MAVIALAIPVVMLGLLLAMGWYEDGILPSPSASARHPEDPGIPPVTGEVPSETTGPGHKEGFG